MAALLFTGCAQLYSSMAGGNLFSAPSPDENQSAPAGGQSAPAAGKGAPAANTAKAAAGQGYTCAAYEGASKKSGSPDSFLACGTGGRLDRVFADGTLENVPLPVDKDLTQVLKGQDITLVSGRSGTLLYSRDGQAFSPCVGVAGAVNSADIMGLAYFKGKYFACAGDGSILESADGVSWSLGAQLTSNPVISIDANGDYIMAVTAETDILISKDGVKWDAQNFNDVYKGYYERYVFAKLVDLGPSFFILGHSEANPGYPLIMYSDSGGEVWMFKPLEEINKQPAEDFYPLSVNTVCVFSGQLLAACSGGRILTVTSCPVCNTIMDVSKEDIRGIALYGDNMLAVGDGFKYAVMSARDFRQNNISAAQALSDFQSGALIIDVRTDDEYNKGHIKGCIHIPVDQIAEKLPAAVPDNGTELIFYCAAGARAQSALETAQQLGYQNVFNLGGFSDWPYETES